MDLKAIIEPQATHQWPILASNQPDDKLVSYDFLECGDDVLHP